MAATLVGAATLAGLDLDAPAALPEWTTPGDPRAAITMEHLLRMSSGLDAGPAGNRSDAVYWGGAQVADHAGRGSLVAPPGARWVYANNDTMLAVRALSLRFASREAWHAHVDGFFDRLGMTRTTFGADWTGDYVMSSQVWTTARDVARFGVLYLNDGVVEGERVLPPGWTAFVSAPSGPQPPTRAADGRELPGYGAQFWLWGARHGLPEGSYAAQGNRGQYLMIVPARGLVIVRRGFDGPGATFDIARFSADVMAAIGE